MISKIGATSFGTKILVVHRDPENIVSALKEALPESVRPKGDVLEFVTRNNSIKAHQALKEKPLDLVVTAGHISKKPELVTHPADADGIMFAEAAKKKAIPTVVLSPDTDLKLWAEHAGASFVETVGNLGVTTKKLLKLN